MKSVAKAGDRLLVDGLVRLDGHVAAGEAGAAGRDDGVDLRVGDPGAEPRLDLALLVAHDRPVGEHVAGRRQPLDQEVARAVLGRAAACPRP